MALLSNLQKSFETFVVVMTKRELAEYVKAVISKLPSPREISEDVARNKMEFIREIVNSELFIEDGKVICLTRQSLIILTQDTFYWNFLHEFLLLCWTFAVLVYLDLGVISNINFTILPFWNYQKQAKFSHFYHIFWFFPHRICFSFIHVSMKVLI